MCVHVSWIKNVYVRVFVGVRLFFSLDFVIGLLDPLALSMLCIFLVIMLDTACMEELHCISQR